MKKIIIFSVIAFIAASYGGGSPKSGDRFAPSKPQEKQLNISILLDLSDRINPAKHHAVPEHYERDIEVVKIVTEYFKKNMERLTAWKAKGKIRIFFSPPPSNPAINTIANILNIDCSGLDNKRRKNVYDTITDLFARNLKEIYQQSIRTSTWEGSDIWRFFKNDVKDYCIDKDTSYRNILIVLTDGYIYHRQSVSNNANRYSYLLESNIRQFRKQADWKNKISTGDFGLISERNDLTNLEVLVLEISAENNNNKIDEDILKYVLEKWFEEMNVSHYEVYNSDLPANTKTRVE
ncbi:MAG: hypothetical protein LBF59_03635, partial [Prevotellaceae bacterium]|nr:hypothetical protein [Prevotellaceae bacterium]